MASLWRHVGTLWGHVGSLWVMWVLLGHIGSVLGQNVGSQNLALYVAGLICSGVAENFQDQYILLFRFLIFDSLGFRSLG